MLHRVQQLFLATSPPTEFWISRAPVLESRTQDRSFVVFVPRNVLGSECNSSLILAALVLKCFASGRSPPASANKIGAMPKKLVADVEREFEPRIG